MFVYKTPISFITSKRYVYTVILLYEQPYEFKSSIVLELATLLF